MGTRLYVGNLQYNTTEDTLREAFGADGRTVTNVFIVMDRETGRPRGFAFVEMSTEEEAKAAMAALDGQNLDGRPLRINEAQERTGGPRRPFGAGGPGGDRPGPRVERYGERPGAPGGGAPPPRTGGFDRGAGGGAGGAGGGGFNDRGPPRYNNDRGAGGGGFNNDRGGGAPRFNDRGSGPPPRFNDRGAGGGGGFRGAPPPVVEPVVPEVDRGAKRERDRERDRERYDRDEGGGGKKWK